MADNKDVRDRIAEALAEKFTSPFGDRNPAWDPDLPDSPDNPYVLSRPMSQRVGMAPWVVFTAGDGGPALRVPSCEEIADVIAPILDQIHSKEDR